MLGDGLKGPRRQSVSLAPWFTGLLPREPTGSGVHPELVRPECNPPPVSSSDEFKDPFSEDTGGGLWEMEGGKNIQGAKFEELGRRGGGFTARARKSGKKAGKRGPFFDEAKRGGFRERGGRRGVRWEEAFDAKVQRKQRARRRDWGLVFRSENLSSLAAVKK
jgi:hypothetical protein